MARSWAADVASQLDLSLSPSWWCGRSGRRARPCARRGARTMLHQRAAMQGYRRSGLRHDRPAAHGGETCRAPGPASIGQRCRRRVGEWMSCMRRRGCGSAFVSGEGCYAQPAGVGEGGDAGVGEARVWRADAGEWSHVMIGDMARPAHPLPFNPPSTSRCATTALNPTRRRTSRCAATAKTSPKVLRR